jgi:hypothetical protein
MSRFSAPCNPSAHKRFKRAMSTRSRADGGTRRSSASVCGWFDCTRLPALGPEAARSVTLGWAPQLQDAKVAIHKMGRTALTPHREYFAAWVRQAKKVSRRFRQLPANRTPDTARAPGRDS